MVCKNSCFIAVLPCNSKVGDTTPQTRRQPRVALHFASGRQSTQTVELPHVERQPPPNARQLRVASAFGRWSSRPSNRKVNPQHENTNLNRSAIQGCLALTFCSYLRHEAQRSATQGCLALSLLFLLNT